MFSQPRNEPMIKTRLLQPQNKKECIFRDKEAFLTQREADKNKFDEALIEKKVIFEIYIFWGC